MLSSFTPLLLAASATAAVAATGPSGPGHYDQSPFPSFSGDMFTKYNLTANGIKASFIPYGARVTNLYVKDINGTFQDIVTGYDEGIQYLNDTETSHSYFGAVVGRYANRIKNGTFTLDGNTYHIPENENDGEDTLHGGFVGYDQQNWTVASVTGNSITFTLYDAAYSGFPGDVLNVATYTLTDDAAFISRLVSLPMNEATPIMLANHIYWNLGAWVSEDASYILNDTLYMPYADRYIDIDGIEIPTGNISMTNGTVLDFTSAKTIGKDIYDAVGTCGTNCTGYDNAFILDRPRYAAEDPALEVLRMYSPATGIQMSLESNQQGLQIYSCNGQDGTIPVKSDQQHLSDTTYYDKYGCIVIETQDWIDAINQPQWGRKDYTIFSPTTMPAVNYQKYTFTATEKYQ
ncbi:galactose mutarotase-like protein [Xylariaceae sp. FL0804]|nr:galactose mutarotase-like protein [Xylariaceae sp. FL0804]